MRLPLTMEMMTDIRLPVIDVVQSDRIEIYWSQPPQEHERELAQRCCMFEPVTHKWQ